MKFKSMKKAELIEELSYAHQMLSADPTKGELEELVAELLADYQASPKKLTKDELIELCEELEDEIEAYHKAKPVKGVQESLLDEKEGAKKLLNILNEGSKKPIESSKKLMNKTISSKKEEPKKPSLSSKDKTESPKKSQKAQEKAIDLAVKFPKTLDVQGDTFNLDLSIKSIEEIAKLSENADEELIFAVYWTPRLIKQFNYDPFDVAESKITKFDNDLDLCSVIHIADSGKVMYVLSLYSDVMYMVKADELEIIDDMRFTNGAEYNIYRKKL